VSWLIARPAPEAEPLAERLRGLGYAAQAYPAIQIEPLSIDHRVIMELDQFDTLIVVSKAAARRLIDEVDEYWPQLPIDQTCIAVGPGTAHILSDYGFAPQVPIQHDSEGVLALCAQAQRILLAAGWGGRQAIEQGLADRSVTRLALYQRTPVALPPGPEHGVLERAWVTSVDIAQQVAQWNLPGLRAWVPSRRVADQARAFGLTVERVLPSASDQALITALEKESV